MMAMSKHKSKYFDMQISDFFLIHTTYSLYYERIIITIKIAKGDNALSAVPAKSPNSAQLRKKSSSAISADDEIIIRKVIRAFLIIMIW